jgi:hypothetical protein
MELLIDETLKNAVAPLFENLQKAQDVLRQGREADRQALLLEALGFVAHLWLKLDPATAQSVGVTFGLKETLCSVAPGGSLIVTAYCPGEVQFELKRLDVAKKTAAPTLCHFCLNPFPPPKWNCCVGISQP